MDALTQTMIFLLNMPFFCSSSTLGISRLFQAIILFKKPLNWATDEWRTNADAIGRRAMSASTRAAINRLERHLNRRGGKHDERLTPHRETKIDVAMRTRTDGARMPKLLGSIHI